MVKKKNVALIGLEPHAKRIYLNYFKKHNIELGLIVDLESKRDSVKKYLNENNFKNTKIYTIDDKYKDNIHLPNNISQTLAEICKTLEISHIIISTEPKAHNMYLEFALKNNIDVLTDKPITVCKNMTSLKSINEISKQYNEIIKLSNNSKAMCNVMCQRQYHRGYEYIKKLLTDVVKKYQVPITYIDIYHCDGNWEMPHDLLKENHPYKYGYGKLFHSGYHFIDLLSDFVKINNQLSDTKKITKGSIYSTCFTPNDELAVFNIKDYKRIFKEQEIPDYYNQNQNPKFNKFGEKNFYGQLTFKNANNQTITTANLNLLHYGFSRRGWIQSKDYYKSNGRIRHERINIQVGTLLNIQVHSYQSKEIKDRLDILQEEEIGGLEHFDIDIYRNVDILGGKSFERIKLGDLYSEKEKKNILGYNELSREEYLTNFLKGKCSKGDIRDQALGIEILKSCAMGIHNHYNNKKRVEKINIKNSNMYSIKIDTLKSFSIRDNIKQEKVMLDHYSIIGNDAEYGVILNHLKNKNDYEIYLYIESDNKIASFLLYKELTNRVMAKLYFKYLKYIASKTSINKIAKKLGI